MDCTLSNSRCVSLFTREWIEIPRRSLQKYLTVSSPSLRGSGLKLQWTARCQTAAASPSLRGSGLKSNFAALSWSKMTSPSLRGSGLKFGELDATAQAFGLPLYEGVD